MPEQTFRYAACGGGNTFFGLAINYIFYRFIFKKELVDIGFITMKPHVASLIVASIFNFIIGFILLKFVVFVESNLRGRVQLFRYLLSFFSMLGLNYVLLNIFVEFLHWEAFLSQCISTVVVVIVSYLSQKHFTFKSIG